MVKKWHVFGININNESSLERTHSCFILRKPHSKRLLRKARRTYKKEQRRTCFFRNISKPAFWSSAILKTFRKQLGPKFFCFYGKFVSRTIRRSHFPKRTKTGWETRFCYLICTNFMLQKFRAHLPQRSPTTPPLP